MRPKHLQSTAITHPFSGTSKAKATSYFPSMMHNSSIKLRRCSFQSKVAENVAADPSSEVMAAEVNPAPTVRVVFAKPRAQSFHKVYIE